MPREYIICIKKKKKNNNGSCSSIRTSRSCALGLRDGVSHWGRKGDQSLNVSVFKKSKLSLDFSRLKAFKIKTRVRIVGKEAL